MMKPLDDIVKLHHHQNISIHQPNSPSSPCIKPKPLSSRSCSSPFWDVGRDDNGKQRFGGEICFTRDKNMEHDNAKREDDQKREAGGIIYNISSLQSSPSAQEGAHEEDQDETARQPPPSNDIKPDGEFSVSSSGKDEHESMKMQTMTDKSLLPDDDDDDDETGPLSTEESPKVQETATPPSSPMHPPSDEPRDSQSSSPVQSKPVTGKRKRTSTPPDHEDSGSIINKSGNREREESNIKKEGLSQSEASSSIPHKKQASEENESSKNSSLSTPPLPKSESTGETALSSSPKNENEKGAASTERIRGTTAVVVPNLPGRSSNLSDHDSPPRESASFPLTASNDDMGNLPEKKMSYDPPAPKKQKTNEEAVGIAAPSAANANSVKEDRKSGSPIGSNTGDDQVLQQLASSAVGEAGNSETEQGGRGGDDSSTTARDVKIKLEDGAEVPDSDTKDQAPAPVAVTAKPPNQMQEKNVQSSTVSGEASGIRNASTVELGIKKDDADTMDSLSEGLPAPSSPAGNPSRNSETLHASDLRAPVDTEENDPSKGLETSTAKPSTGTSPKVIGQPSADTRHDGHIIAVNSRGDVAARKSVDEDNSDEPPIRESVRGDQSEPQKQEANPDTSEPSADQKKGPPATTVKIEEKTGEIPAEVTQVVRESSNSAAGSQSPKQGGEKKLDVINEEEEDSDEEDGDGEWTPEQERDLVAAIFEIGLKNCSPSVIMDAMQNLPPFITRERTKSHLQKYRKAAEKSKEDFLEEYDTFLKDVGSVKEEAHEVLEENAPSTNQEKEEPKTQDVFSSVLAGRPQHDFLGGEAAALLTFSVHNNAKAFPSKNNITGPRSEFPDLTEAEKGTKIGKSLLQVKGLINYLTEFLVKSRHGMATTFGVTTRRGYGAKGFGQLPQSLDDFFPLGAGATPHSDDNDDGDDDTDVKAKSTGSQKSPPQPRRKKTDRSYFKKAAPGSMPQSMEGRSFMHPGGLPVGQYPSYASMPFPSAPYAYTASMPSGMSQYSMTFPPPSGTFSVPPPYYDPHHPAVQPAQPSYSAYPHHQYDYPPGIMAHHQQPPPPHGYYPPRYSSVPEAGGAMTPSFNPAHGDAATAHRDSSVLDSYQGGHHRQAPMPPSRNVAGSYDHRTAHIQQNARSYPYPPSQEAASTAHRSMNPIHESRPAVPQSPIQYPANLSGRREHLMGGNYDNERRDDHRREREASTMHIHSPGSSSGNRRQPHRSKSHESRNIFDEGLSASSSTRRSDRYSRTSRPRSSPSHADDERKRQGYDTYSSLDNILQLPSQDNDDGGALPKSDEDSPGKGFDIDMAWEPLSIDTNDHRSVHSSRSKRKRSSDSRQATEQSPQQLSPLDSAASSAMGTLWSGKNPGEDDSRSSSKRRRHFFDDDSP